MFLNIKSHCMQALVIPEKNHPIEVQTKADLKPAEGEVIVKVYAAALNHRDVWIQKGQYAGLKYPITPGSDGAGVVVSAGSPGHQHWIGQEVIIDPSMNWGDDPACQDQKKYKILGLPDDGTFAEYVRVPATNLVPKPARLSFEEAASLPIAGVTAYRALFTRAQLRPGEKVLITGIGGGVALMALQFAAAAGAIVYVSSGNDGKLAKAIALGASGGVNYNTDNWAQTLQELSGSFDVIVDGAGGDGMGALLGLARPGARLVFYGATRGNPTALDARKVFWKQLNLLGSTMGNPEDFAAMIAFVNKYSIRPVVDKIFSLAEGESALRHMDDAQQFGKIVIRIS
jgi:zinc-binding alcohol dehydrogenase/oxidoreductase